MPTEVVSNAEAGLHDLQPAVNDERSECTRSEPSVASRRVAAPYGVDVLAINGNLDFKRKMLKFSARYARKAHLSLCRARYARRASE